MGSHRVPAPVLLTALLAASAAGADGGQPPPAAAPSPSLAEGRSLYLRYCATCHGVSGDGKGPTSTLLRIRPRDFTTGAYRFRTTASGTLPTDDDLARTIRRGVPGTRMPSWEGVLSEEQIRAIIPWLRQFGPKDASPSEVILPNDVPTPPPATPESIARGRNVFRVSQCWQCHGIRGDGNGPAANTLTDDRGEPIRALNFTLGYLKGGGRPEDVYRTLMTGLDGSPMPSFRDSLTLTRENFQDLSNFDPVLTAEERRDLEAFIATLPTAAEFDALSEEQKAERMAGWRWDLVHYIRSLGERNPAVRYLVDDPYMTE